MHGAHDLPKAGVAELEGLKSGYEGGHQTR